MYERRKIPRKYMMYYTRIFRMPNGEFIGHLVDITKAGAMLISESPIAVNHTFQLKMELSPDVSDRPFMLFQAKSIWCRKDVDPHFYNTGFQLIEMTEEDLETINRIVEAYGFRSN